MWYKSVSVVNLHRKCCQLHLPVHLLPKLNLASKLWSSTAWLKPLMKATVSSMSTVLAGDQVQALVRHLFYGISHLLEMRFSMKVAGQSLGQHCLDHISQAKNDGTSQHLQ